VAPEFRSAIFERFRQVEGGATRRHGGTGLGLAIAKDFVTLHRGTISVGAAPEGGALFTMRLPLKAPGGVEVESLPEPLSAAAAATAVEELRQPDERTLQPAQQGDLGAARAAVARPDVSPRQPLVLVIEDNLEMNRFITGTLRPFYRAETAFNGKEGLEKARAATPDLVLLDVMMPETSGDEVLRALRADTRFANVPVVLLTAKSDQGLRVRLLREGAQDYITKPFMIEELLARVDNLLKIKSTRQDLETANQELEAFSYSVSHDLRAPLRAIRQLSQVLLEDYGDKLDPDARGILDRIMMSGSRLDLLIRDVLAYSRVIRSPVQFWPVKLDNLIFEVIQQQPALQAPQATISIQSPLLPVLGHDAFLTQCFSNLLENAVKFVSKGKAPEITVRTEPRGSMVRIWVEDNGIGIEPRHQQRLFNLFERVHSEQEYEGTGIGLSIVRKAVERMGGTVGVESEPGKGSRFWMELLAVS
jgi:signal transduction histidine kinase